MPKQNVKFTDTIWNEALNKNYMESDCDYTESLNPSSSHSRWAPFFSSFFPPLSIFTCPGQPSNLHSKIFIRLTAESHVRAAPVEEELQAQLWAGDAQDSLCILSLSLQDGMKGRGCSTFLDLLADAGLCLPIAAVHQQPWYHDSPSASDTI